MTALTLRPASADDARLLWEWANDPETRRVSFSTESIPWESHLEWLGRKLDDPCVRFYIALDSRNAPVAQVRFDVENDRAVVSVSVAPTERGKGYGVDALQRAAAELWRSTSARTVDAYIKHGNTASLRAFEAAGYQRQPDCTRTGISVIHMTLERPLRQA